MVFTFKIIYSTVPQFQAHVQRRRDLLRYRRRRRRRRGRAGSSFTQLITSRHHRRRRCHAPPQRSVGRPPAAPAPPTRRRPQSHVEMLVQYLIEPGRCLWLWWQLSCSESRAFCFCRRAAARLEQGRRHPRPRRRKSGVQARHSAIVDGRSQPQLHQQAAGGTVTTQVTHTTPIL